MPVDRTECAVLILKERVSSKTQVSINAFQIDTRTIPCANASVKIQVCEAERLCSALKSDDPAQRLAFVCNWRVAVLNEWPDDVVRSEFDPIAFVNGVGEALQR